MKQIPPEIYEKFIKRLKSIEKILNTEKSIVVGVSGGPDSMFLLFLLYKFSIKNKLKIIPVYVNHQIRTFSEIQKDIETINLFCKKKGIELIIEKISPRKKDEETLRELRYKKLFEVAKKFNTKVVATAHVLDDVVETFLLNLIRGSGLKGLCSIPAIRKEQLNGKNFHIIRPIIDISKCEILEVLKQQKIKYTIDKTNKEIFYKRNFLRNKILPLFDKINSNYKANILKVIEFLQQAYEFIEENISEKMSSVVKNKKNCICIDLNKFLMYNSFIQSFIIHRLLSKIALRYKLEFKQGYKKLVEKILNFTTSKQIKLNIKKKFFIIKSKDVLKLKIEK